MAGNVFDANGLTLATRDYWVDFFETKFQEIYGPDVNVAADTPDGQFIGIVVQVILDLQDLIGAVNASFDPDQAYGVVLDQRVSINGIQRLGGTFTITPITITTDRSVNLYGLDQTAEPVYTVSDNEGNRWQLQDTQLGLGTGTHVLNFQAEEPGAQLTIPNTITTPVTVVLGVVTINNPTTYTSLGINEESDAQLKVRRQQSVSLASQGYYAGLYAALLNINGVTGAFIYENNTDATDSDGVPSHTIWVIVGGSAPDADIANAIYRKRNAGCGMFGDQSYTITQINGTLFIVNWDVVIAKNVFCRFTATSIDGVVSPNINAIREGLPTVFTVNVFQPVDTTKLGTAVQSIDDNTLVTNAGFTLGEIQTIAFSAAPSSGHFRFVYDGNETTNIAWNDNAAAIEAHLQAVPGLENITVTGSIASQSLVLDLTNCGEILDLIGFPPNHNTLAPGTITLSNDPDWQNVVNAPTKQNQLLLASDNIFILAMQLLPATSSVSTAGQVTFVAYGGYGRYRFTISVNNSGGTINANTGAYTAGGVGSVTDTILVTDDFGNTATATVSVV